jgi:CheY-like chemotaxis protein
VIKVLIIEDKKEITDVLHKQLSGEGFDVFVVNDSSRAIDALKKDKYDIVLLSIFMSQTSGIEILSKVREDMAINTIPIIVMDEFGGDTNIRVAEAMGAKDFIIKGKTKISEIVEKIQHFC